MSMGSDELNWYLEKVIADKISTKKEERKENVDVVERVTDELVCAMLDVDDLFNKLFVKIGYSGSYYEGVRIKDSCEFDLNLILKLPLLAGDVEIIPLLDPAAYVQLKLLRSVEEILRNNTQWTPQLGEKLRSFFRGGYLVHNKFQNWMQSVTRRAMNKMWIPDDVHWINYSKTGPGGTLHLVVQGGIKIDVDVVPVIDCSRFPFVPQSGDRFMNLLSEYKVCYLVPKLKKPRKWYYNHRKPHFQKPGQQRSYENGFNYTGSPSRISTNGGMVSSCNGTYGQSSRKRTSNRKSQRNWRVSFPEADKKLIYGMNSVKSLIKLFKLLRDNERWFFIFSYSIVNFFLLEIDKQPSPDCWEIKNLGPLFVKMLVRFRERIKNRDLRYYYVRRAKLFETINPRTAEDVANRLAKIISAVENNPRDVLYYWR